jgi:hypothetical protein
MAASLFSIAPLAACTLLNAPYEKNTYRCACLEEAAIRSLKRRKRLLASPL